MIDPVTLPCSLNHPDGEVEHLLHLTPTEDVEPENSIVLTTAINGLAQDSITIDRIALIRALGGTP